ncbi:hypothetical protein [Microbacterium amylolyticum]|uniref:Methyl-accepting chemotaxis protein n=1 Tax=Microbacterium amylolyticum TaxID=936337 RepID=A0ABS4ZJ50_9MICO|nr:hypothetical protein [Microbacterium amylolyticum]MBP2437323.1 methyl-accepting chemotaxis protein [Microbacterium amylolyticum]
MTTIRRIAATIGALALIPAGLAACSGGGSQSVADGMPEMPDFEELDLNDPEDMAQFEESTQAMGEWSAVIDENAVEFEAIAAEVDAASAQLNELCGIEF